MCLLVLVRDGRLVHAVVVVGLEVMLAEPRILRGIELAGANAPKVLDADATNGHQPSRVRRIRSTSSFVILSELRS